MNFLVIGIGSAGERHIKNLRALGVSVSVYDKYADVFTPQSGTPELTPQLTKLERLIQEYGVNYEDPHNYHSKFDAFVICTPPSSHTEYIVLGMQHYAHIFVEKPISDKLQYLDWIVQTARNKEIIVQVGYQLRFHPGLQKVKELLDEGRIGKLLSIRAEFGQYLPDWHPNQDYRNFYAGKESEGGGIILDASHELDYVRWLVNSEVKKVSCVCGKLSDLDIDVEDTAEIELGFENGVTGDIHVDMTNREYTRFCRVIGSIGDILWDYRRNELIVTTVRLNDVPLLEHIVYEPNDPYLEEMKDFIYNIYNKQSPLVGASVGKRVLEIALAAKQSSKESKVIEV